MLRTDSIDIEIVKILLADARISLSKLCEKTNLSINGVRKRIVRMEQEGVIKGYSCELKFGVLGEESGLAKVIVNSTYNIEGIIDTLGSHKLIFTIGAGMVNQLIIVFTYRSTLEIIELENWLKANPALESIEMFLLLSPPKKKLPELAAADYRIIFELKNKGRMTLQNLSKKTQISTRTLKKRLERMMNLDLIHFSIALSPGSAEKLIIFTTFCTLDKNINKIEVFQRITKHFSSLWVGWIVIEKPVVILSFFTPNIKNIRKIEDELREEFPIISIDTIIGGEGYHFDDWRTKHIELMANQYKK